MPRKPGITKKSTEPKSGDQPVPGNAKRSQILQGALTVFLEYGYKGTSMDRVAEEAGVSKQTIYSHFEDKERLFHELVEHLSGSLFPEQGDQTKLFDLEPEAFLIRISQLFFEQMDRWEYKSFFRVVVAESGRFPELAQMYVRRAVEPGLGVLVSYFEKHPELALQDAEVTARVFRGSLASFALVQDILQGKRLVPMSRERFITGLVETVLHSYERRPG